MTENEDEYQGLLLSYDLPAAQTRWRIIIRGVSTLVIRQRRGKIECKVPGLQLWRHQAAEKFRSWPADDRTRKSVSELPTLTVDWSVASLRRKERERSKIVRVFVIVVQNNNLTNGENQSKNFPSIGIYVSKFESDLFETYFILFITAIENCQEKSALSRQHQSSVNYAAVILGGELMFVSVGVEVHV